jgi:ribosomal protein L31E
MNNKSFWKESNEKVVRPNKIKLRIRTNEEIDLLTKYAGAVDIYKHKE